MSFFCPFPTMEATFPEMRSTFPKMELQKSGTEAVQKKMRCWSKAGAGKKLVLVKSWCDSKNVILNKYLCLIETYKKQTYIKQHTP